MLQLHIEEQERGVNSCLLEIVVEDAFVEAGKDITLARQKDHLQVLQVAQEEHSTVHHVQKALVDKFVLVGHHLDDILLDCQGNWHFKHIVAAARLLFPSSRFFKHGGSALLGMLLKKVIHLLLN